MPGIIFTKKDLSVIQSAFNSGKPVVLPTDTIYGIAVPAQDKKAVTRLYRLRKRNREKPFIIMISSLKDLSIFDISLDKEKQGYLKRIWPNELTVILDCSGKKYAYLHRGTKTLGFRIPNNKSLLRIIRKTGPLVVPSANIEGMPEATSVKEAFDYFKEKPYYIDKGKIKNRPSTIISLVDNEFKIIRQGSYKLKKNEYFRPSIDN